MIDVKEKAQKSGTKKKLEKDVPVTYQSQEHWRRSILLYVNIAFIIKTKDGHNTKE